MSLENLTGHKKINLFYFSTGFDHGNYSWKLGRNWFDLNHSMFSFSYIFPTLMYSFFPLSNFSHNQNALKGCKVTSKVLIVYCVTGYLWWPMGNCEISYEMYLCCQWKCLVFHERHLFLRNACGLIVDLIFWLSIALPRYLRDGKM